MHDPEPARGTFSRRLFLRQGFSFLSLAATTPMFLDRTAFAVTNHRASVLTSRPGVPDHRILVVVQLGGGNDGLNTVIPFGDPTYYRMRPGLAIPEPGRGNAASLALDGVRGLGLHPSFSDFKDLLEDGSASIIQGVGYPNPNRSHFASMDIWQTARTDGRGDGWLGRYFDNTCCGSPQADAGVAIGRTAPLAMTGRTGQPVAFESAEVFRWTGEDLDPRLGAAYQKLGDDSRAMDATANDQAAFLTRTSLDARISSDRIRAAAARRPLARYPGGQLSRQLQLVASMVRADMPTRVYYVSLGGFDTHAGQQGQHARLLSQLGSSLKAFKEDLRAQGNSGRVLTMVFSEFGRRVAQNASAGTDHGTAAPMYLVGDMVRPGLLGDHPSLTNLDQGDLIHNVDFRHIYAAVLEQWMGADASAVLGGTFKPADILAIPS